MPRLVALVVHSCIDCPYHETNSAISLAHSLIQLCMKQETIILEEEYLNKEVPDWCPLAEADESSIETLNSTGALDETNYLSRLRQKTLDASKDSEK